MPNAIHTRVFVSRIHGLEAVLISLAHVALIQTRSCPWRAHCLRDPEPCLRLLRLSTTKHIHHQHPTQLLGMPLEFIPAPSSPQWTSPARQCASPCRRVQEAKQIIRVKEITAFIKWPWQEHMQQREAKEDISSDDGVRHLSKTRLLQQRRLSVYSQRVRRRDQIAYHLFQQRLHLWFGPTCSSSMSSHELSSLSSSIGKQIHLQRP